jgi:hypothetical protein
MVVGAHPRADTSGRPGNRSLQMATASVAAGGKSGSSPDNCRPSRARDGPSVSLGIGRLLARPALPSPVNRALSIKVESPA